MEVFRFKKFTVRNEASAMKVNTDGVLLGALMTVSPQYRRLLDIGTGTGCIALMAAQRLSEACQNNGQNLAVGRQISENLPSNYHITAIDIDEASAQEAAENFAISPWAKHLEAKHISLADFTAEADGYDMIFSNPPYFESALKASDPGKRTAKHANRMSYREVIEFASRHLSPSGRLAMILPAETESGAVRYAGAFGLSYGRIVRVRTTPQKRSSRIIVEFAKLHDIQPQPNGVPKEKETGIAGRNTNSQYPFWEELTIHKKEGGYSDEYRSLVKNFLQI